MFSTWTSATAGCRRIAIALMLTAVVVLMSAGTALAQAAPQTRVFTGDVGLMYNVIKPDKGADFEMVVGRLKEALAKSENPERKAQAAGWRVLKQADPMANGNLLYVFILDPVVKDADYTASKILAEAFPAEVQELFKVYAACFAGGVTLANYSLVADLK